MVRLQAGMGGVQTKARVMVHDRSQWQKELKEQVLLEMEVSRRYAPPKAGGPKCMQAPAMGASFGQVVGAGNSSDGGEVLQDIEKGPAEGRWQGRHLEFV